MFDINFIEVGEVGVAPREVKIITDQSLATIVTAGWLNNSQITPNEFLPTDYISIDYAVSGSVPGGTFGFFRPSISSTGQITLIPLQIVGSGSWGGGTTTNTFTAPGLTATSVATVSIQAQAGTAYIVSFVPGTNTLAVTFSGNPGAGTIVNWIASNQIS